MSDDALQYDAIVIGAGINGLVTAGYLAKAGKKVVVLEAASNIGAAAATDEISPDYQVSTAAHIVSTLPKKLERDLKLSKHGLAWATRDMETVAVSEKGKHIILPRGNKHDLAALTEIDKRDGKAWPDFEKQLKKYVALVAPLLNEAPLETGPEQSVKPALGMAYRLEKLGGEDLRAFLQMVPASIADHLDRIFENDLLKAALAFEATLGHFAGPNSPGTAYNFLYQRALESLGQGVGYPAGGTGALAEALASSAEAKGVRIRLDSPVKRIMVENGRATGVHLVEGTFFSAPLIFSSADPKTTCLNLIGAREFETGLARRIKRVRAKGCAAKVNLALEGLPTFENFTDRHYGGRLIMAPSMKAIERNFTAAKRGELALEPVMEAVIPSYHDPRLAPMGHHVMSVIVPHVPFEIEGGWETRREEFVKRVVDTIALYAPDIKHLIIAGEILTPPEIADKFGQAGAHWHQCDMSFDQLMMFRPAPGIANYALPVEGVYLCGAGTHPGGGLSGLPGKLAAETALRAGRNGTEKT